VTPTELLAVAWTLTLLRSTDAVALHSADMWSILKSKGRFQIYL
jgi:hypothetical protein